MKVTIVEDGEKIVLDVDVPTMEQLEEWVYDSVCESLCGCLVEPDGYCEHGKPSWLLFMGLI